MMNGEPFVNLGFADLGVAMACEDNLVEVERALVREKAIRSTMARTGEGRQVVAEAMDAMQLMDEESVLELAEGAPTTMRDAITRYIRIMNQESGTDEVEAYRDRVASDLDAILEYPWVAEEEFLASHAGTRSLKLNVRRIRDDAGFLERVEIRIGGGWLILSASAEHHNQRGLEAIASGAGHVHRAVLARVIGDRDHHVQLNSRDATALADWLTTRHLVGGSFTTGTRLSVDAVSGGGILVRTRPYTYERHLAAEQMRHEDARRISESDVIRALNES